MMQIFVEKDLIVNSLRHKLQFNFLNLFVYIASFKVFFFFFTYSEITFNNIFLVFYAEPFQKVPTIRSNYHDLQRLNIESIVVIA